MVIRANVCGLASTGVSLVVWADWKGALTETGDGGVLVERGGPRAGQVSGTPKTRQLRNNALVRIMRAFVRLGGNTARECGCAALFTPGSCSFRSPRVVSYLSSPRNCRAVFASCLYYFQRRGDGVRCKVGRAGPAHRRHHRGERLSEETQPRPRLAVKPQKTP